MDDLNTPQILHAKNVGSFAAEISASGSGGIVIGITSQGVFLNCDFDQIVFITTQPYRGPLTINIRKNTDLLKNLEMGMGVEFRESKVFFPDLETALLTSSGEIWDSPAPQVKPRSDLVRDEIIKKVAAEMIEQSKKNNNHEIADLVEMIFSKEIGSSTDLAVHSEEIGYFIKNNKGKGKEHAYSEALSLLGKGEGLTPAGDDVVLGLVLALNRWKKILLPDTDLSRLNHNIVQGAYQQTTTLSANLIECATDEQSDERLTHAVDMILYEMPFDRNVLDTALNWGSSSGNYALIGILCAILFV